MKNDTSYSPLLWAAISIPIISGLELFIDPSTRNSHGFFILGFFYLVSIRYTLAVGLGVYAHEISLEKQRYLRTGAILWFSYFLVLVLCSLLVPGAAIFGVFVTIFFTLSILLISILQGVITIKSFSGADKKDIIWRLLFDCLLVLLLIYEFFILSNLSFQSPFFVVVFLIIADFTISDFAKSNLVQMTKGLHGYLCSSWSNESKEIDNL